MGIVLSRGQAKTGRELVVTYFCGKTPETESFPLEKRVLSPEEYKKIEPYGFEKPEQRARTNAELVIHNIIGRIMVRDCEKISIQYKNGDPDISSILNALIEINRESFTLEKKEKDVEAGTFEMIKVGESVFSRGNGVAVIFSEEDLTKEHPPVRLDGFDYTTLLQVLFSANSLFLKKGMRVVFHRGNPVTGEIR